MPHNIIMMKEPLHEIRDNEIFPAIDKALREQVLTLRAGPVGKTTRERFSEKNDEMVDALKAELTEYIDLMYEAYKAGNDLVHTRYWEKNVFSE